MYLANYIINIKGIYICSSGFKKIRQQLIIRKYVFFK